MTLLQVHCRLRRQLCSFFFEVRLFIYCFEVRLSTHRLASMTVSHYLPGSVQKLKLSTAVLSTVRTLVRRQPKVLPPLARLPTEILYVICDKVCIPHLLKKHSY